MRGAKGRLRKGSDKSPSTHAPLVGRQLHFPSRGEYLHSSETGLERQTLHYSSLLFGEEGVDRSNYSLVSHWFNRPGGKKFDAGVVVRNNIVF